MPLISVIIPLYNKVDSIRTTIDSVLAQKFENYEIIVVDDGSTDNSRGVISSINDKKIHYYWKANGGVSSARNYGIEKSSGDWLLFLDADDELSNDSLVNFYNIVSANSDVEFIIGAFSGKCESEKLKQKRHVFYPYYELWCRRLYARPGAMLVKRSLIELYGVFDTNMSFYEDYEFTLRMMMSKHIYQIDKVLSVYNETAGGLSSSSHPIEKEMAYYIPTMQTYSFWHKTLLYENLQLAKLWWQGHSVETSYYDEVERKCFDWRFRVLHWIRQKMIRRGLI